MVGTGDAPWGELSGATLAPQAHGEDFDEMPNHLMTGFGKSALYLHSINTHVTKNMFLPQTNQLIPPQLSLLKLHCVYCMALALYTAGNTAQRLHDYPWADWTSLQEAWEVAEHFKPTYSNTLKVYAALLIDTWALGYLALGGRSAPGHLQIDARGKPINLPTRLWGN